MHTSNTDHDETLKEQIDNTLKYYDQFDLRKHEHILNEANQAIVQLIKQDRERAVNAGRIEELEKLITLNKTLYGVEAEMTRRANNRLAELSNLIQEKGKE